MKRKIKTMLMILLASLLFPAGAFASEIAPDEITPVLVDSAKKIKAGGDKIHIIKVFEQKSPCDAILLESDGHFAMVDVGAPYDFQHNTACDTENSVVNYLKSYGVEKLDFIIFTHLHTDHIGNIENVMRTVPVDTIYARQTDRLLKRKTYPSRSTFKAICKQYKTDIEQLYEGEILTLGNLNLKVFNLDDEPRDPEEFGGENGNCVDLLVTDSFGHRAFLAADMNNYDGDEDRLVANHADELSDVDFFKVGHHGFEGSSTFDFIQMLNPLYVAVSGYTITGQPDPFGDGNSVWDNYKQTRAYAQEAIYYSYYSNNGVIFTMGETLSINDTYKKPSRTGRANNTLSIFYNANGGKISDSLNHKFCIDKTGIICNKNADSVTEKDYVQQRMFEGDVAPMYYYDMARTLEKADTFGLTRTGHTFEGWYVAEDRTQELSANKKYNVLELAPDLKESSSELMLVARWKANPYRIIFFANGGKGSMKAMECIYNKQESLPVNGFSREHYVFKGWNTKPDGSGEVFCDQAEFKNLTAESGKTVALYAQWEKIGVGDPQKQILSDQPLLSRQ